MLQKRIDHLMAYFEYVFFETIEIVMILTKREVQLVPNGSPYIAVKA